MVNCVAYFAAPERKLYHTILKIAAHFTVSLSRKVNGSDVVDDAISVQGKYPLKSHKKPSDKKHA